MFLCIKVVFDIKLCYTEDERRDCMKYIMTLFWSFILGHVVYYLGSSLASALPEGSYDLLPGTILGLSIAVAAIIIAHIMKTAEVPGQDILDKPQ